MLGQLRNEIGKRAVASSCDAAADEELVAAAKKGDELGFESLAKRHQRRIFALAFRHTRVREDAEDIVQETLRKAAERGHRWHESVSEHLRFTSSVAEFMAATWTTGCRRNASSRKSTTRATMGGRKRNDVHTDTIVLAIAKTPAIDTPRGE